MKIDTFLPKSIRQPEQLLPTASSNRTKLIYIDCNTHRQAFFQAALRQINNKDCPESR